MASASMSMAAMTACSASSEYGGRRLRYGSGPWASVEDSTSELDIFPGWPLPRGIPEEGGGVVGDDQRDAMIAMDGPAKLADRELGVQQRLRGEGAERDDDLRADQLELLDEVRAAGDHFLRQRIAVARRPVLEDVADEYILTPQANGGKNL